MSQRWDSNPRPRPYHGRILPLNYTGKWGRTAGGWADLYAKHSEALGTKQIQSMYFTSQRRNKLRSH